ncbi:MAG TPA: hypothetical protein VFX28_22145, partial [Methylomirabilota bacterium]|nr:hypothetical protein [Methylomirabilota bacterium]
PQRRTIEEISAGAVLVLDCRGIASAAGLGDILVARLKARGAAGAVLDGGVRDFAGIAGMDLPVYAQGAAAPANVHRHYAVEANVPIGCADVLVMPGDIMVGDGDGVVCIPRAQADKIAEALERRDVLARGRVAHRHGRPDHARGRPDGLEPRQEHAAEARLEEPRAEGSGGDALEAIEGLGGEGRQRRGGGHGEQV